ncbi:hypothetical protein KUTeg_010144 [Tegillarca granosa]|uniref:Methyltransferase FkbM domain-containing protein n=1 Tax=Tegillarca granosa TaxID=220873 RepID=A0ABQ9F5W6_TEGGR|nr:hypothetical protein KUTeg_010144 [Tegillarca granosa]
MAKYESYGMIYIDPYRDLNHTVRFVPAFISERDGMVQFPIKDRNGMTGNQASQDSRDSQLQKNLNLDTQNSALKEPQIKVRSISVKTFVQDLHIPQFFGVLSIDTKGVGDLVIHGFISLGFRPAYIIYEHESEETWEAAAKYFAGKEYKCLTRRGKNFILEHIPKSKRKDNLNSYMYNFF